MSNKNIKNEIAYFNKVIKNMEIKENIKKAKIKKHEFTSDAAAYDKTFDNFNFDKYIEEQSLLGWIDLIENENLHKAVKGLSEEEQIFISYICKECKTQRELAKNYSIAHQNIGKRFNRILKKLRKLMKC